MRLALFDLDRTMIDVNSGRLWLASEWRDGRIGWRDVVWASYWIGLYSLGWDKGLEEAVNSAVASLEGTPERDLDGRVQAWFTREVRHRTRPGANAAVERHREAGDLLVLATSGTSYAARAAAEAWGFHAHVATTLEVTGDGLLTGRIARSCLGPHKARAVEAWAAENGHDLREAAFYTDSATDLELLDRVGQPVVVHPDRLLRRIAARKRWPIEWW